MAIDSHLVFDPTKQFVDLSIQRAAKLPIEDDQVRFLIRTLAHRVSSVRQEHDFFRTWCDRADQLYFATTFTDGGADLWPDDKSANTAGRSHVSVNDPSVYVDVPASLQSVTPIENMLATDTTEKARKAAAALERLYTAWKQDQDFEVKFHKAAIVKALYGRTAGRVYWDDDQDEGGKGKPEFEVIEQPRNLWFGWKTDNYDEVEWAAYVLRYDPNALAEEFGVDVGIQINDDGTKMPYITVPPEMQFTAVDLQEPRPWLEFGKSKAEVWDYWYRKPIWGANGRLTSMMTMNVVIAGTLVLRGPDEHPEFNGELPYVPLFNTFIPGVPTGRSELHDMEQLIRETYETITAGSQMIHNGVAGDYWQLVGADAPNRVPAGLKPMRNQLVAPGPGNRIETITPFIAQFQLEQYLGRIDRTKATVSGLNDLLLGLAPAQVLSSSKAINALIANYESRIAMRRALLYQWRKNIWELALSIWKTKDDTVKKIVANGAGVLSIIDPSLSPRDEMETANRAANLVAARIWSQRRAMDAVGVDDPETEQDMIREERTDATMFPESVQVMAQLMGALQQLGLQAPAGAQQQAQGQLQSGQADLRTALGAATPDNTPGMQSPDTQGQTPPIPGAPPEAGGPPPPFASGPGGDLPPVIQDTITGGKLSSKIKTQQQLGRR